MSSRTVAILFAAAAIGVAGGTVLGRAPGDGREAPRSTSAASPTQRASSATPSPEPWLRASALRRSVAGVASRTGVKVGVVVRPLGAGDPVALGTLRTGAAWSTIKVPLALAHYQRLPDTSDALVSAALRRSDNAAAQRLFDDLAVADGGLAGASADIQQVLRQSGDLQTTVNTRQPAGGFSTYGQTTWSLALGTRFFSSLARGCLQPTAGTARILSLMGQVAAVQRWGIGRAHFAGASTVRFKGGWGPGTDGRYLVRQFGVVQAPGGRGVVLALAATAKDGSFAGGIAALDALAAAAARTTRLSASPRSSPC